MADNPGATSGVHRILGAAYACACDELYHRAAWSYDWVSWGVSGGAWDAWRRVALSEVLKTKSARPGPILEIGFGTGELLLAANLAAQSIVGLEASPQMHRIAGRKLAVHNLCVPRVQATALAMPFAGESFTAVISTFPSGYILAAETLEECARVLRPCGRLIVAGLWVVPTIGGRAVKLPLLYGRPSAAQIDAIRRRVEAAGFAVEIDMRRAGHADVALLIGQRD